MNEYRIFVQSMYDRTCGFYKTYGITVFEGGKLIRVVKDVSSDREKVERLVERFNAENLSPEHLNQAIEDFLLDFKV